MGFDQMFIGIISYPLVFISVIWVIDLDKDPNKHRVMGYISVFFVSLRDSKKPSGYD